MSNILGQIEADSLLPEPSLVNNMCSVSAIIKAMSDKRRTEVEMKEMVSKAIVAMIEYILDGNRVSSLPFCEHLPMKSQLFYVFRHVKSVRWRSKRCNFGIRKAVLNESSKKGEDFVMKRSLRQN